MAVACCCAHELVVGREWMHGKAQTDFNSPWQRAIRVALECQRFSNLKQLPGKPICLSTQQGIFCVFMRRVIFYGKQLKNHYNP